MSAKTQYAAPMFPTHIAVALATALLLAACGPKSLSGTYGRKDGLVTLEFRSNGKVEISGSAALAAVEADYVVEDKKLKLTMAGQPALVMAINDKGCIDYPYAGALCKL